MLQRLGPRHRIAHEALAHEQHGRLAYRDALSCKVTQQVSLAGPCCAPQDHQGAFRNLIRMQERLPCCLEFEDETFEPNPAISERVTSIGRPTRLRVSRFCLCLGVELSLGFGQESRQLLGCLFCSVDLFRDGSERQGTRCLPVDGPYRDENRLDLRRHASQLGINSRLGRALRILDCSQLLADFPGTSLLAVEEAIRASERFELPCDGQVNVDLGGVARPRGVHRLIESCSKPGGIEASNIELSLFNG